MEHIEGENQYGCVRGSVDTLSRKILKIQLRVDRPSQVQNNYVVFSPLLQFMSLRERPFLCDIVGGSLKIWFNNVLICCTVEPRLSGLVGTTRNSPDNRGSG